MLNLTPFSAILVRLWFWYFFEKVKKVHGNIDLLINNASTFKFDTIKKTSHKIFDKHINVNLKAPFFLSKILFNNYQIKMD